jgi:hypothetical protein
MVNNETIRAIETHLRQGFGGQAIKQQYNTTVKTIKDGRYKTR